MLYIVGDCYIRDLGEAGYIPDNIIFDGYSGVGIQQRNALEDILAKYADQLDTNKAVNQKILLCFGHVDVRDTSCNKEDILELTDYYIRTSISTLGKHFSKIYFAEPFAMYADTKRKERIEFEILLIEALKKSAEKYNVKIVLSQKEVYEAIGKDAILRSDAVKEKNNINYMWPEDFQVKTLDLILKKALTL